VLHADEFMQSTEFQFLSKFMQENFPPHAQIDSVHLHQFFYDLKNRQEKLELTKQLKFEEQLPTFIFKVPLILSTGGYND
jgi:hypothetical protein